MNSSLTLSSPPPSLSRNWDHNVFPSFHGPDVRKTFLSHVLKEFRNKGIEPFIDNNIERSKSIGPELERAIKGSKIAIVLLSANYSSSSWCLDELLEVMKCRDLGQTVMTIFYEVDPTVVKKQTGDFGKAFRKTCRGKTKDKIETWRKALEDVATIAGYHSKKWDDEAAMIETITTDIWKMLNHLTPSCDFERYIGMGAHIGKMKPLLSMDSDEVRMIGIWGPPGIGKSTIARFLFNKLSNSFQLKAHMVKIKECYPRPCLDKHNAQLVLQSQMLSQVLNKKDMVITHLGIAQERLKEKKVLLVLDDVDEAAQLNALAEDIKWFGPGSRIIITTQDLRVLTTHGIKDIYTVDLPSDDEALQMFCMSAFGHNYPKDGFRELSWQIVCHVGKLPLGLEVMGSYFRNMSKQDWKKALPKLWSSLDGKIESILKFSYDALEYDDKYLFLHIACLFVNEETKLVKEFLVKTFLHVSHGLDVLASKSLISMESGRVKMHDLLVKLCREIVRKQSKDPGQRQFLLDSEEISDILDDDGAGSGEVIGINFNSNERKLNISERAFEGMSNLQFLKIQGRLLHLPQVLSYISSKLRLLHWNYFSGTCLPSNVKMKFLVEISMSGSEIEKLWEGTKCLPNLKRMDLSYSRNLKELPDLSTATNLEILDFSECSRLVELPSSIGNAITNLEILNFSGCPSLSKISSSIGNAINLKRLDFRGCSSLLELPVSIGNLHKLKYLKMEKCFKLEVLPLNVNMKSLDELDLSGCSSLKIFPEISTNIRVLDISETAVEEVPSSIRSWSRLEKLDMHDCKNFKEFPHALESITKFDTIIQKVQRFFSRIVGFKELLSPPQLLESLSELDCSKLEVPPANINLKSLDELHLRGCSSLKKFPEISTNIRVLDLGGTAIEEVPSSIRLWSRLEKLDMYYCKNLKKFAHGLDNNSPLSKDFPPLRQLILSGCKELMSLPQLSDSLEQLDADNCESLERLHCFFCSPKIHLNFPNCFKLNKEARNLIIHKWAREVSVLPGEEIPRYFNYRANGDFLRVKLSERPFCRTGDRIVFKACILLVSKNDIEETSLKVPCSDSEDNGSDVGDKLHFDCEIMEKNVSCTGGKHWISRPLTEHLYIYKLTVDDATSGELSFKFTLSNWDLSREVSDNWVIKECGVHYGGNEDEEVQLTMSDSEEEGEDQLTENSSFDNFEHYGDNEDEAVQ